MKNTAWKSFVFIGLAIGTLLAGATTRPSQPRSDQATGIPGDVGVRGTIQRAIPFIEKEGNAWIKEKQCVTCHQVPYMHWSLNLAKSKQFQVDEKGLANNNAWVADWVNLTDPDLRTGIEEGTTLAEENDAIAALLLGAPYRSWMSEEDSKWQDSYRSSLIDSQRPDGSWNPRGQLPKQDREFQETIQVSTMWAMLAIGRTGQVTTDSKTLMLTKEHLGECTSAASTEWLAVRLLFEQEFGARECAGELRQKLVDAQNDDGGWGWLLEENSDAFGTGIAIYALHQVGVTIEDPVIVEAQNYLMQSQAEDGSWPVNGTKQADREYPTPTATYWGTCWAVIGLLETLPASEQDAVPRE